MTPHILDPGNVVAVRKMLAGPPIPSLDISQTP